MKNIVSLSAKLGTISSIVIFLFIAFSFTSCGGDACQKIDHTSISRVECKGGCPSTREPNCYVKVRKANSRDDWEKSGNSTMDKTPGMEYACYCDK